MEKILLGSIADIQTGPFGSQLHKEDYVQDGTPIVTVEHLGNRVFTEQNLPMVSDADKERLNKYVLSEGDIVFSRVGSVDRCSYVDSNHSGWMFSGRCLRVRPYNAIYPLYLYYFFCMENTKQFVRNIAVGATMPSINTKLMGEIEVSVPSIDTQKRIAAILSAIDDKIELNTAINENLEQQAYLLLEQMLNSSNNQICALSDIAYINPRYTLSKGTEARYIDMSQLSTTTSFPDGWTFRPYNGGMKFKNKDTIMARITPCLENGKTAYIDFLEEDETAFGSTEYIVLSPKDNIPPELLYCIVRYPEFRTYATINMNGSSGRQRVSGEIIGKYEIPSFSQEELSEFGTVAEPLFKQITENSLQNRNLSALRDTLLPKLMNGEIDVSAVKI